MQVSEALRGQKAPWSSLKQIFNQSDRTESVSSTSQYIAGYWNKSKACLQNRPDTARLLEAAQNACVDLPLQTEEATRSLWTVSVSV